MATARLPLVAVVTYGTMPRKRPHVMKSEDGRFFSSDLWKREIVEEVSMDAVQVQDVGFLEDPQVADSKRIETMDVVETETAGYSRYRSFQSSRDAAARNHR